LAELEALLGDCPSTLQLSRSVIDIWPEHRAYLSRNFKARSHEQMTATELASSSILKLISGDEERFARHYRWTCDRLNEEELFFHRNGRYRLSTFAEALAEVYSNADYMTRYMDGLLLTQSLWFNHAATFEMFLNRLLPLAETGARYLEIGPGHGLMTYFAARTPAIDALEVWDVSSVSLDETRTALAVLGIEKSVSFTEVDILAAAEPPGKYDMVVISEVLEHLERPEQALVFLNLALNPGGLIYVNVPINSPSPDHIYLLEHPAAGLALIEAAGFKIVSQELYATQGRAIEKALRDRISVSMGVVGKKI
jgi:2-polyprenyl-3-methyl-5-hydroxy-6-metoxy-1,4-benzoquinol methylase